MYKTIVVGTDGSVSANRAVVHAAELAKLSDAELHVVHAYRLPLDTALGAEFATMPLNPVEWRKDAVEQAERTCSQAAATAEGLGAKVEQHLVPGDAAEALITVAEQSDADLLVIGNRGMSGVRRFVLGSVPNKVSHHSPCHLLILHTCV
jgi:nucleotide-binding universal stress UspA family protein